MEIKRIRTKTLKVLRVVWLIFGVLLGSLFISEGIKIGILGKTDKYYFGPGADNPYYYRTAELYSIVSSAEGIIFLAISVFGFIYLRRKELNKASLLSIVLLVLIIAQIVNSKFVI